MAPAAAPSHNLTRAKGFKRELTKMSWNHTGPSLSDIRIEYLDGLFGYAMVLTRNQNSGICVQKSNALKSGND
jgi:hypothetical protein